MHPIIKSTLKDAKRWLVNPDPISLYGLELVAEVENALEAGFPYEAIRDTVEALRDVVDQEIEECREGQRNLICAQLIEPTSEYLEWQEYIDWYATEDEDLAQLARESSERGGNYEFPT